jgi:hypothetical protein
MTQITLDRGQRALALLGPTATKRLIKRIDLDRITEQGDRYNRYTDINHEALRNRVSIWKLRQKMREHGIEIETWRGVGYYLDDENKAKLKQLMEKKND